MKFTDEDGKVWEWEGEYHTPQKGQYFFSVNGKIRDAGPRYMDNSHRAIVRPVPTIHEFGGVKFEETGEVRLAQPGEWYLVGIPSKYATMVVGSHETGLAHTILRPLQGEK